MHRFRSVIVFFFLFCSNLPKAQLLEKDLNLAFNRLRDYNETYERFTMINAYKDRVPWIKEKLQDQINLITNGPDKEAYKAFLVRATGVDSLLYKDQVGQRYDYHTINPIISYKTWEYLTRQEYYKAVYYCFFELRLDHFVPVYDIPFLKQKYALVNLPIRDEAYILNH